MRSRTVIGWYEDVINLFKFLNIAAYSTYSDGELLKLLRADDVTAFGEIYNRYHLPLYRLVISLVKIPEMAEDIVQEVFIKVWDIRSKLEIHENFGGYLFRMCRNKVADIIKQRIKERSFRDQLRHAYLFQSLGDELYSREQLLRYDNLVEEALNSLSPQRRRVFEMCRNEGKTHAEVAKELQISTNTVKEHMSKALSSLRNFLEQRGELPLILLLLGKIF